ncbi:MAG: hypothetical protein ABH863_06265, partial [Candidatus Micrarchaeota archaeon]
VITESADNIFNFMDTYGVAVNISGIPIACRARLGIYKLTIKTSDGQEWKSGSDDAMLSTLPVSKTTNGAGCTAITACNLFDSYYGLPEIFKYSGKEHCFGFDWPIVPYGDMEINGKQLDLRNAIYLGTGGFSAVDTYNVEPGVDAPMPPNRTSIVDAGYPVFSLSISMPQNGTSLENALIYYKLNISEIPGEGTLSAGTYAIGLAPDYFGS